MATHSEISKAKRNELDALLVENGLKPEDYGNVATAREALQPYAEEDVEDEETGEDDSSHSRLENAIADLGVDEVKVWKGDDNGLVYARMVKDEVTRLLSIDENSAENDPKSAAKDVVAQAGF